MSDAYNEIAGRSIERLAALSDGIFAVAMTLLVLDLRTPASATISSEDDLMRSLANLGPHLLMYAMSFLTLGIFWAGQQTQLNHFARSDRNLTWIHLAFLFCVSIMPFATRLLSEFIRFRVALLIYWGNILALGVVMLLGWRYAIRAGLLKPGTDATVGKAFETRVLVAQSLYALGAALCFVSTYLSIAWIVLVQLNYAIAPRQFWKNARNSE